MRSSQHSKTNSGRAALFGSRWRHVAALAVSVAVSASAAEEAEPAIVVRDAAGAAHAPLADGGRKATVLLFLMSDCPVAKATSPAIARLAADFDERGVRFFAVYATESAQEIATHHADFELPLPGLLDPRGRLARRAGATRAPEAAVFSPSGELLYRGRIDDRATKLGSIKPKASREDLRLALEAILAGKTVEPRFTEVVGCYLPLETAPGREAGTGRIEVDLFVAVDCPIANAYAPEINRLHRKFGASGVRFRLVYPDPELTDEEVKLHRTDYALEPEGVRDPTHALVERAGASVTPEAAVFDPGGTLRYRGKIDDRFTGYGDKRRVASEQYLEDVLAGLLSNEEPEFREVRAVGCLIEPVPKPE